MVAWSDAPFAISPGVRAHFAGRVKTSHHPSTANQRKKSDRDFDDPEPRDTDVGAPVDQPADLPVRLPSGAVHRPANDNELLEAASWIDWNAAEGAAGM